ncbi:MAG: hypothetical protein AB7E85_05920 [Pseudobdellovibrionaceae bacterium]
MIDILLIAAFFVTSAALLALLLYPKVRTNTLWRATVTPLASIIGSGFLVAAPLLDKEIGAYAFIGIMSLVGLAFLIGRIIRFNIHYIEPVMDKADTPKTLIYTEKTSHIALAFAYFVSVAYYLYLLSAFLLKEGHIHSELAAKITATAILGGIIGLGVWKGLRAIERTEIYAVSLKLAIIGGFLVCLAIYDAAHMASWQFSKTPDINLHTAQVLLGLLIIVQGFETARFMGDAYDADTRAKAMRAAQILSALIYFIFFLLLTPSMHLMGGKEDATAILNFATHIGFFLSVALTVMAVASQFSASIADTIGSGGLIHGATDGKVSTRHAYLAVGFVGTLLIWTTDLEGVISYASRAFALFYALQCLVAMLRLYADRASRDISHHTLRYAFFGIAMLFCIAVTIFGIPADGG